MKEPDPSTAASDPPAKQSELEPVWQKQLREMFLLPVEEETAESIDADVLSNMMDSVPQSELVPQLLTLFREARFSSSVKEVLQRSSAADGFWGALFLDLEGLENSIEFNVPDQLFHTTIEKARTGRDYKIILELLVQYRQWEQAHRLAVEILKTDTDCSQTRLHLARSLRNLREFQESLAQWETLLRQHPDETELYGEVGNTHFAARQFSDAIEAYQQVIRLSPTDLAAYLSLFAAAKEIKDDELQHKAFDDALPISDVSSGDFEAAVKSMMYQVEAEWTVRLIKRWLELHPENPVATHLLKSIDSDNSGTASDELTTEYIQAEFDGFAETFENRLKLLGYRGPQALAELLDEQFADQHFDVVLDAGCGTGSCSAALRHRSTRLDGVDLSEAMLRKARSKAIYDNLYQDDLNELLDSNRSVYDLIASLDTFIYMGQLPALFRRLKDALKPGGLAIFNLELLEDDVQAGVKLQPNGRFAHALPAIEAAIAELELVPHVFERRVLRIEHGNPVYHVLIAIQRAPEIEAEKRVEPPVYQDKSTGDRIEIYQKVIRFEPRSGTAHFQLGNAFLSAGQLDEARQCFELALDLESDASTLCNLGNAYAQMGKLNEALLSFEKALGLNPDFVPALNNAGRASFELGHHSQAIEYLHRAIALEPENPKSHVFLGNIFLARRDVDSAIESYQKSIQCDANQPDVHMLLGNALVEQDQLTAAAASFVKAQQLTPQNPFIYDALGNVNHLRGQITEASFCFLQALQLSGGHPQVHSHMIHNMIYDFTVPLNDVVAESQAWAGRMKNSLGLDESVSRVQKFKDPDKQLSIGFVHPNVLALSVFRLLHQLESKFNRDQFRLFHYTSEMADRNQADQLQADGWNLRWLDFNDNGVLAKQIQSDQIDILIDLSGHTPGNCLPLFFAKPTALQMVWPIECEPPALAEFDYVIGSPQVLTKQNQEIYLQKSALLDGPFLPYVSPVKLPELRESLAPTKPIQLACTAPLPKLSADAISSWGQILIEISEAQLILANPSLGDDAIQRRILDTFGKMGISDRRVQFQSVDSDEAKLKLWNQVDIGLDSLPVNSPYDTFLALLMGCPVVTLAGIGIQERTTKSLLEHASLSELVVDNKIDYINAVVELAGNLPKREGYLSTLREQVLGSANCDTSAFAVKFEELMRQKWKEICH